MIEVFSTELYPVDSTVMFISHFEQKIVGFGRIKNKDVSKFPVMALVEIKELVDHQIILQDDQVFPLESRYIEEKKVPGFLSLTMSGDRSIPSKYKELAFYGVFTADGHVLDKDELLVGPLQVQYGVTNDFTVKTVSALFLDGYINAGAKYQIIRNQHAKFSVNSIVANKLTNKDMIFQGGGVLTLPTNSKYQTHFAFSLTFDKKEEDGKSNTEDFNLFKDSEIRNIYEYVTDSWDRILLGPTYNFTLQTVGGTLSYMWIWDSFHLSAGVGTRDFTELRFGDNGYYPQFDFFWRI